MVLVGRLPDLPSSDLDDTGPARGRARSRPVALRLTRVPCSQRLDFASQVEHQPGEPDAPREQRHRVIGRFCAAELLDGDRAQRGAR
jgi:hypothetical protein